MPVPVSELQMLNCNNLITLIIIFCLDNERTIVSSKSLAWKLIYGALALTFTRFITSAPRLSRIITTIFKCSNQRKEIQSYVTDRKIERQLLYLVIPASTANFTNEPAKQTILQPLRSSDSLNNYIRWDITV